MIPGVEAAEAGMAFAARAPEAAAFELWLGHSLRRSFDAVIAEPVPDALLQLLGAEALPKTPPRTSPANPVSGG
jgi:hypothetical protein